MPASEGTPTVWEKLGAVFGLDGANNQAVLAGDMRDLSEGEQILVGLFKPILGSAEQAALGDLATMLQAVLKAIPSLTSVSGAMAVVNTILEAEAGPLQKQAIALGQTSLTTLVTAALAAVGKANLPLVS